MLLQAGGVFAFFFILPLGAAALGKPVKAAWIICAMSFVVNTIVWTVRVLLAANADWSGLVWECGVIGVVLVSWAWVIAPPNIGSFKSVSAANRIAAGAACMFALIAANMASVGFETFIRPADEYVRNSLALLADAGIMGFEGVDARDIAERALTLTLHGGGIAACMLFFAVNRQISASLARMRGNNSRPIPGITNFYTGRNLVWVLAFALLGAVAAKHYGFFIVGLAAWNVVTAAVLLYMAQGAGIALFYATKWARTPFSRLFVAFLAAIMVISAPFNVLFFGGIAVLGLSEHWIPLRKTES